MHARSLLGRDGEAAATDLYRRLGYEVVDRNYRSGRGEIDLVCRRGDTIVFCEVKTRSSEQWGLPSEAVGAAKQAQLKRLAAAWLAERKPGYVEVRFDIVSVIVRADRGTEVTHIPDAF
ncbi:MAG TPA: YraN family protein [Actinomycetota bacterium]|nr:YraN family protein [Actinomycetota bacterium]